MKTKMKKAIYATAMMLFFAGSMFAQYGSVGINNDGLSPNASAMLDVRSTDKGLLIPQIALQSVNDITTIADPAVSLLVYNTTTSSALTAGYYYWTGSVWTELTTPVADGSETKVTAGTNVTVTGTGTTANPYVVNATGATALTIGQSYQGGKIFWLDATGQHGLIAAISDQETGMYWIYNYSQVTGAVGDGLYAGAMNTVMIVVAQMQSYATDNAATLCADYSVTVDGVAYGDWYLPSRYELGLLWTKKDVVGGFSATDRYWSSTEFDSNNAYVQLPDEYGYVYYKPKSEGYHVRAIRAF